ncbi:hypothetical protein [Candidatus Hecatella orcuttiae]|jgi:hypothetical protein|uniref:hypothetical protein n=1 Tax=Candidatus Hecatella orcuttiae TaxID=1935119 RepID=UPI002867C50E|nr:hypothetical protein [Candidatus Hecatella orcuttiae]
MSNSRGWVSERNNTQGVRLSSFACIYKNEYRFFLLSSIMWTMMGHRVHTHHDIRSLGFKFAGSMLAQV